MSIILPPAMQYEAIGIRQALDHAVKCIAEGNADEARAVLANVSARASNLSESLRQPITRDYAPTIPAPKEGR